MENNKENNGKKCNMSIVIFGCGYYGKKLLDYFKKRGIEDIIFLVGDGDKGSNYLGVPVIGLDQVKQLSDNDIFVISSPQHSEDMKKSLIALGIDEYRIFFPGYFLEGLFNYKDWIKKRTPRKSLRIVFDITEHCNLNCKNCDHFAPLARKAFMDSRVFFKDLTRIKEIAGNRLSEISLEGGEPLLHPQINLLLENAREICPESEINIISNGLLLDGMEESFWKTCMKNNVMIKLTKYPISFNYDEVLRTAEKNQVNISFYNDVNTEKMSWHKPLDVNGMQDIYESFHNCYMANGQCSVLNNGKFYQCTFAANLHIFSDYYDFKMELSEKDALDIYDDNITLEDILNYLCNPIPACRFCRVKEWTKGHKWGISQKLIEEWT